MSQGRFGLRCTRRRLLCLLAIGVAATGIAAAGAQGVVFADYNLHAPCCNGDSLWGSRASIRTPGSTITFGSNACLAQRSYAQEGGQQIQTGFVTCAANANVDGTCATVNKQVQYVEIIGVDGLAHCYSHGVIGLSITAKYTVDRTGSVWLAYIDGVADTHTSPMGAANVIGEGAEWQDACGSSYNSGPATYGSTQAWQRWTGSTWFTVQSAYTTGSTCGFSIAGGPTGTWSIAH
jgi:hypothetical protein